MREQQQAPLSIVEYYQTLPHWRKHLCHWLEQRARQTGIDLGVSFYNAVSGVSYPAGYWFYKTLHGVGYNAGFWLSIIVSGYPWNKYRSKRPGQKSSDEISSERGIAMSSSLITSFPAGEEQIIPPLVVQEVDLGEHYLLIRADNSIELCDLCDETRSGVGEVLILNQEEVYHLFISLKEVFK